MKLRMTNTTLQDFTSTWSGADSSFYPFHGQTHFAARLRALAFDLMNRAVFDYFR